MPKARVIISDFQHGSVEVEQGILGDLATVEALEVTSEEQMWGRVEDADAIMVYHTLKVTRATIERLTRCKLIVRCGVGYDNVDHLYAKSRGIAVANVPDYGTEEVADSAIGLLARSDIRHYRPRPHRHRRRRASQSARHGRCLL
jgi:D-3-phosphoglycerate dehydrogenase/C-terminal binding protein